MNPTKGNSTIERTLDGVVTLFLHGGEDEILLDDSRRYAERFAAAGGVAELHIWEGMTHVFPSSVGTFAASELALDNLGAFLFQPLR